MNTFTKKSLHVALAGLGTLGLAGAADAIMVNPNGLGQVLIYPYYTVRSPAGAGLASYNTLLSVGNTTNSVKAVKVRFREGKASAEVLDFNVFLSPHDMWTAAVEPGPGVTASGGDGAQIETSDRSCTIPNFTLGTAVPFRTGAYEGDAVKDNSTDRLTEGYFEIFEMATYDPASVVAINATHSGGVPKDCSKVTDSAAAAPILGPVTGGLWGGATLINVLTGDAFTEDATALVNYIVAAPGTPPIPGVYSTTGQFTPNFSNTLPFVGTAVSTDGLILSGLFVSGPQAATMAFQHQTVVNEFIGELSTLSGTDWVVTFPTKHHFVSATAGFPPFSSKLSPTGSCDAAVLDTWDREETPVTPGGPDFSPSPTPQGFALCWEANILSFKSSLGSGVVNVLGSANSTTVGTGFTNGWARLTYDITTAQNGSIFGQVYDPTAGVAGAPVANATFFGLPTVGFAVQTFVNGTLTDAQAKLIQSSYGGNFGHRYTGP